MAWALQSSLDKFPQSQTTRRGSQGSWTLGASLCPPWKIGGQLCSRTLCPGEVQLQPGRVFLAGLLRNRTLDTELRVCFEPAQGWE